MSTIAASETGWWYSAPLPDNMRVLALQTDADLADTRIKTCEQFTDLALGNREMAAILERNQGAITFHKTAAASSTRLQQPAGEHWVALGDAAISFDPLSSQGMFNAMATALQLTDLISEAGGISTLSATQMQQLHTTYTQQINQIWEHYLKHKKTYYSQERRWSDAEFWKRRH
jgi:flavin-dependent dehydrogenase